MKPIYFGKHRFFPGKLKKNRVFEKRPTNSWVLEALGRFLLTNCNADPSNFSVKSKERLEIHLHKCSFETQMLRRAGASSFLIRTANRVLCTAPERTEAESKQSRRWTTGEDFVTGNNEPYKELRKAKILRNSIQSYASPDSGHLQRKKCQVLISQGQKDIEYSERRNGCASHDIASRISFASWQEVLMLLRSAGSLECRPEA